MFPQKPDTRLCCLTLMKLFCTRTILIRGWSLDMEEPSNSLTCMYCRTTHAEGLKCSSVSWDYKHPLREMFTSLQKKVFNVSCDFPIRPDYVLLSKVGLLDVIFFTCLAHGGRLLTSPLTCLVHHACRNINNLVHVTAYSTLLVK